MTVNSVFEQANASEDVVFMTDRRSVFSYVNRAFERVYGYAAGDVVGKAMPAMLKTADVPLGNYLAIWERLTAGESVKERFTNRARDGRIIEVEAALSPLHDEHGEFTGFLAIERDITADALASAALAQSEARYRTLAEASHDAIYILNGTNQYTYVNQTGAESLGRPVSAILAHSLTDCFPPAVARGIEKEIAETRAAAAPLYSERSISLARGTRWMSTWLVPMPAAGGEACEVMGVSRDITERHEMAEALERQHHVLDAIIQASPIGIALLSEPGWVCEMVNDAMHAFTGCNCQPGQRIADAWPEGAAMFLPLLEQAAAASAPQSTDIELPAGDGATSKVKRGVLTTSRIQLPRHTGATVLVMLSDMTERHQLEAQFLQAQKMEAIGRLAGGIAHDFNNLLTPILGYAELVKNTFADRDPRREDLDEVTHAAQSASALTRRLLTFSRKQVVETVVLDLNHVLAEVEKIVRRAIGEDVRVVLECQDRIGNIRADRTQIEQIIMNLGVNARDAMPSGGTLTIATAEQTIKAPEQVAKREIPAGRYVVLTVTDTGTGMTPEVQSHLFEPFFTTKEFGKGTGLGLSTVYGIVSQSGGYVSIRSRVGAGTTFRMYFPVIDEVPVEAAAAAAPGRVNGASTAAGHETILVVEDNTSLRRLARRVLADAGYTTLVAESAEDAMTVARNFHAPIHLLLTDVVMPTTDGPTLAAQLLIDRPDAQVLFMSGYSGDDVARHGAISREVKLLQKPFTQATLTHMVRHVLDRAATA